METQRFGAARRLGWLAAVLAIFAAPATAQRNIAGAVQTRLALERLETLGSLLLIGAHPDDENTALLASIARGRRARAAYLSLTRGDGGQNLVGSEQGALLGVMRTQELLAARRVDGAEQYFTRAVDFGFSKTADETFEKWGRETILGDVVWTIRRFRPDVIVTGVGAGHGHHQAAAILTREAFAAAADKTRFPEQLRFVEPWQAKRLISSGGGRGGGAAGPIQLDAGEYDPLLGFSYTEIAGMSRSMHRSQGFGSAERRGASIISATVISGEPAAGDIFSGVDITWSRLPGGAAVQPILREAAASFVPGQPDKTIGLLLKARPLVAAIKDPWAALKLRELDEAIALCAGLWLDAASDKTIVSPGGSLQVTVEAINRSRYPLTLKGVALEGMDGAGRRGEAPAQLAYNQPRRLTLQVTVPRNQPYSQPYWMRKRGNGFVYEVEDPLMIGVAETPPALRARIRIQAGAEQLEFLRPVVRRYVSRVEGETTTALVVAPLVAVEVSEPALVFPSAGAKSVEVLLRANAPGVSGEVRLQVPAGWRAEPASAPFRLSVADEETTAAFTVTPPAQNAVGELRAIAVVNGTGISHGMRIVAHGGIPPQTLFPPATARLVRTDARTLARRVGYIMGAGDEVPRALRQLGCEVVMLTPEDLARGDLSGFDAIVTGVRAYNVRPDLAANQQRLLDYVEAGGALVVQYLTAGPPPFGPFPLRAGNSRVTVEEAPVTFLDPAHALLNAPNKIEPGDLRGWIQERGLNFLAEWDPRYQPLFQLSDPNEEPQRGATVFARYGKGAYVFTAFSWFRQLPAGVPGAYRMFANFLSAAKVAP